MTDEDLCHLAELEHLESRLLGVRDELAAIARQLRDWRQRHQPALRPERDLFPKPSQRP